MSVKPQPLHFPNGKPDSGWLRLALWCGATTAGFGILGLAGWLTSRPILSAFSPQYVPMSPLGAAGFLLLGSALWFHLRPPSKRPARFWVWTLASLAIVLGAASLVQILADPLAGANIFHPPAQFTDPAVIRISRFTALGFMLAGSGVLALGRGLGKRLASSASWFGLAVAAGGFVILLGYAYGTPLLYGGTIRPVGIGSATALLALGVGLMAAAGPSQPPLRLLVGPSVRAQLLRTLLPVTFLVVLLDELLSDTFRAYASANPSLRDVLQTLISAVVVTFVVLGVARRIGAALDRAEAARRRAEAELRQAHDELELRVEERTAALTRANQELQHSEERFRQLAESIREVFWMTDPAKNRLIYVSPAYEAIWGRTCESLRASPRSWIEAIHPDDRQRVLEAALTKQVSGQYDEVYRIVRPDGAERWIHDRAFPVRDASGTVYRITGIAEDITQRKQAEAEVATLAHAVESTAGMICITDLEDRFTFVNRAFEQAYGYTEAEVLGQNPRILVSPNNPPSLLEEILAQSRRGGWRGEVLDRRKDGSEFPVVLSTSLVKEPTGRVIGLMGIAYDITERKRAEKQRLAFSTLGYRLSAATTRSQAARLIMDIASELFEWDAGYVHLYSPAEDKIIPLLTLDRIDGQRVAIPSESFTPEPSALMRRVMAGGAQLIERTSQSAAPRDLVPFGDSTRLSASMMYAPIHADQAVVGLLSVQSYTPRAYSQEDLGLLQALADYCGDALQRILVAEALGEAEAKYRTIFEGATEGIFQSTPAGRYLSANPAMARMFGYDSPETFLAGITDIERQIYAAPQRRLELKRLLEIYGRVQDYEVECRRKDGTRGWISINIHAVRDGSGAIRYYEGTNRDITERKRLEAELLEISSRERRRFGYDLHDGLGQYLTGAALKAKALEEMLAAEDSGQTQRAKAVVQLLNDAIRQTRSLAQGLDPVQIEAGGLITALEKLAAQTQDLFQVRCAFVCRHERLALDAQTGLALYRIAQEAIHNALNHGRARRVQLDLAMAEDRLRLSIEDDGRGFDADVKPGPGMGLRIMRYRANSVGGTLMIDSRPGRGTRIQCLVPAQLGHAAEEKTVPELSS